MPAGVPARGLRVQRQARHDHSPRARGTSCARLASHTGDASGACGTGSACRTRSTRGARCPGRTGSAGSPCRSGRPDRRRDAIAQVTNGGSRVAIGIAHVAVEAGLAYAWLPEHLALPAIEAGTLRALPLSVGATRRLPLYLILAQPDAAGPAARRAAVTGSL